MNVLIVDDQRSARRILAGLLEALGVSACEASSLDEARKALRAQPLDLVLIDLRLGADARNRDGLTLVREVRERTAAVPVVVTAYSDMTEVRAAMRMGAWDYILKEDLCEELVAPLIEQIRERSRLEGEVLRLRAQGADARGMQRLVGTSAAMERLRSMIARVAVSTRPVLVVGPTGAGKEEVVRALHALGPSPDDPLLDINCGAIPESLMESQLFGHERGAFSGADRAREGLFGAVRRGTLFLDEIGELPLELQAKLLRVLENGRFRAVGATADRPFVGRVIAATHRDLAKMVAAGAFREDLFYRLNVLTLRVPSLAERADDIPLLVAHFAAQQQRRLAFSPESVDALSRMGFPGNIRQLRNLIDRIAVFAEEDVVTPEVIASFEERAEEPKPAGGLASLARSILKLPVQNKLAAIEQALVEEAMRLAGQNKTAAARLLGVHRKAVERRMNAPDDEDR